MKRFFLILFFVASVAQILSQLFHSITLELVSKPLLVVSLALYYVYAINREEQSNTLLFALAFSWLGDVLLMFQSRGELYFIFGLLAFLTAHIFFIFAYKQHRNQEQDKALMGVQRFRFSFPIVLAGTGLITVLYNHLGDLKIPVMVYALVLVVMVINALFRVGRTFAKSFAWVFAGAVLFMLSDSLIAINKFLMPVAMSGFWIMATYIAAQFLIVQGLIMHNEKR